MQRAFLSFNCEFQYVQRILIGHHRPLLDTSRIATQGGNQTENIQRKIIYIFRNEMGV